MRDRENRLLIAPATHVNECAVALPGLPNKALAAHHDSRHDPVAVERGAVGRARQVEVEAPEFVRRQTTALLVEVAVVSPGRHRRVRALLGRRVSIIGKRRVCREIAAIPAERIVPGRAFPREKPFEGPIQWAIFHQKGANTSINHSCLPVLQSATCNLLPRDRLNAHCSDK